MTTQAEIEEAINILKTAKRTPFEAKQTQFDMSPLVILSMRDYELVLSAVCCAVPTAELNALKQEKVVEVTVEDFNDLFDMDCGFENINRSMVLDHLMTSYPNGLIIVDGEKVTK